MSQPTRRRLEGPKVRETYEEYRVGESRVAMISDPENEYAWIQSDLIQPIVS